MIILLILATFSLDFVLIQLGEISLQSLLGLKGSTRPGIRSLSFNVHTTNVISHPSSGCCSGSNQINTQCPGLCSSRARWPLVSNFGPWATRKSQIFHTNHMLGTLDFTVSEHWAPFTFPQSTALSASYEGNIQ